MHKRRFPKTLKNPPSLVAPNNPARDSDNDIQFELELCWCVQQFETALNAGKLSQKAAEETAKNLKILKGGNVPLIKKRQLMKAAFGNYREKMLEEEKKMMLASKQIKFANVNEVKQQSSFVKKSAILTSGKSFRFNFDTPANDIEDSKDSSFVTKDTTRSSAVISKDFKLSSDGGFKFNFDVDEENSDLDMNSLSINK